MHHGGGLSALIPSWWEPVLGAPGGLANPTDSSGVRESKS